MGRKKEGQTGLPLYQEGGDGLGAIPRAWRQRVGACSLLSVLARLSHVKHPSPSFLAGPGKTGRRGRNESGGPEAFPAHLPTAS